MFGHPPSRWAKSALRRKDIRIAVTIIGVLILPVVFGSIRSLSDSSAPFDQSAFSSVWGTNSSSGQASLLSELRSGAASEQDFSLAANVTTSGAFIWPAVGQITSYMDASHPMGIDIGLDYDVDSPVVAAAGGVVEFAGGGEGDTYGYYIKVDHGGGLETLYAHLDAILVEVGQPVAQGDLIGYGGSTGKSSGKHLHFEVRQGNYLANPLELLPAEPEGPQNVQLDCNFGILVMDRGGSADLDFSSSLPAGSRITAASVRPSGVPSEMAWPQVQQVSDGLVRVATAPFVQPYGSGTQDSYGLDLVIELGHQHFKTCELNIQTRMSAFTAYSDASYAATSSGYEAHPEQAAPETLAAPAAPVAPTIAPTEVPLAVPTGVPLLGELTPPTPSPTATATATTPPAPTRTPAPAETPQPTVTPETFSAPGETPEPDADSPEDEAE